jgi:hypothetical protein
LQHLARFEVVVAGMAQAVATLRCATMRRKNTSRFSTGSGVQQALLRGRY